MGQGLGSPWHLDSRDELGRRLCCSLALAPRGIWRIPVDEIDRPGSFASHMNRSIVLLLQVLSQLKDYGTLLRVSSMLQRTPDQGKKYLRDADRQVLAQRAFVLTVKVLEETLSELTEGLEGHRMTTDVSNKPSAEDGNEVLPKKPALSDGGGGGKGAVPSYGPLAVDVADPSTLKECPRASSTEPMELETERTDAALRRPEAERPSPARTPKDRGPDGRPTELSLEDLSISSRQPQPLPQPLPLLTKGSGQSALDEAGQRPSRKRKLLDNPESGKSLLLDAYRVWQHGQKVMAYDLGKIEKIMSETYMLIKQVDEGAALEQAVKFCQVHLGTSAQRQATGDTPTTPKPPKDSRESFFWANTTASPALQPVPSNSDPAPPDIPPKAKPAAASKDPETPPSMACPAPGEEPAASGRRGALGPQQQETHVGLQVDAAATHDPELGHADSMTSAIAGRSCGQASSSKPSGSLAARAETPRVKARLLPTMPKLVIPSSISKFPPEITVTPPTPTLLSPKGSISEETKQKLKSAILSAQSAATVKKENLCQPALEILEMSSQESSLESESDEDEDYMDI